MSEQGPFVPAQGRAGADVVHTKRLQHADEAIVSETLELANRAPVRLRVGLALERCEQLVGQLGDVGQLRPRPLERRTELVHEMTHALVAPSDPVQQECAHDRPSQARAEANRVVDLLDGRDPVVDEPERFSPERLEQAVGDETVDLVLQA